MLDKIERIGNGTLIQHGKHNDRIYVLKFSEKDDNRIIATLNELAKKMGYTKIFCKIPKWIAPAFFSNGFIVEACIPSFYNNKEDVFFVSKFLGSDRILKIENKQLETLSLLLKEISPKKNDSKIASHYSIRKLDTDDIGSITTLYKQTFETYPFPIHEPEYILQTMKESVQYFGVEYKGKIVAVSSSEIDFDNLNAEMTDFATSTKHAGKSLSLLLLNHMEMEMKKQNITTLYTIARLNSVAMNKTFIRNKYKYAGTLIKNTNISGEIESMNVYYKHL